MSWLLAALAAIAAAVGNLLWGHRLFGKRLPDHLSPDPRYPWWHRKRSWVNRLTGSNTTLGSGTNWEWRRLSLQYGIEVPHPPDYTTVRHEWHHRLHPVNPIRYLLDKGYKARVEAEAEQYEADGGNDETFRAIAAWLAETFA